MGPPTKVNYEEAAVAQSSKWVETESVEILTEQGRWSLRMP